MAQNYDTWTQDARFEAFPPLDIEGRGLCLSIAPAGERSWGIEGFLFTDDRNFFGANSLDWYRAHNREGGIYLYGRERRSEWGLVRLIQGDAWNGSQCQNSEAWYMPPAISAEKIAGIELDYEINTANLLTHDSSWLMIALNLWLDTAEFPKPLVIDLVLSHQCNNTPDCSLRHFEDDLAFHYMHPVTHIDMIDFPQLITNALHTTYLDECHERECVGTLPSVVPELRQFDFVIELHQSEAAVIVKHLSILENSK